MAALANALALHQSGQFDQARDAYSTILAADPENASALHYLGMLEHQSGNLELALASLRAAIECDPQQGFFYVNLGNLLKDLQQLPAAEAAYQQALALDPGDAIAAYNLGHLYQLWGQWQQAAAAFERATNLQPGFALAWGKLAAMRLKQRLPKEALTAADQALAIEPANATALFQRASALGEMQQWREAQQALEKTLELQPLFAEAHNNLGLVHRALGDAGAALAAFQQAIQSDPSLAAPWCNLAQLALDGGELQQALAWCDEGLQRDGRSAMAHFTQGNVLNALGQPVEAAEALGRALALQPNYPEALNNLGNILLNLERKEESISAFQLARQLRPDDADVLANLANAQQQNLLLDQAEASLRQALALQPNFAAAHSNLGNVLNDQGLLDQALESYRHAIALGQNERDFIPNYLFCLNYSPNVSDAELNTEHRRLCSAFYDPLLDPRPLPNSRDPQRRLRIGYVSPDFCRHPVARFLLPVLAHHNREQFELVAYSNRLLKDSITAECARHMDLWRDVRALSDQDLAQQIRDDGIDILVDLTMHSRECRPGLFARRAAPVQLSYLAYVGTTGLAAMDYRITDAVLDPADAPDAAETPFIERPLRLPQCWWCFAPSPFTAIPEPSPPPCRQNGVITFGSLNNVIKLNSAVRELWVRLVTSVPKARLLLHIKHTHSRTTLLNALEHQGLPRERVELVGYQSEANYMATYNRIDIALDPSPFAGGTTSFDALWMGVPVITLPGSRRSSRGGQSILSTLGRPEWIAHSEANFIAIGQRLAADPEQLASIRSGLRNELRASPLMDHAGFTRAFEALLHQAADEHLSRHCQL